MFSCKFWKISKSTFFTEHLRTTASEKNKIRLIENQSWGTKVDVRKSKNIKLYASQSKNKISYNIRKKRLIYKNFKTCLTVFKFFNEPFIFIILCIWYQSYKWLNFTGVVIIPVIRKWRMVKWTIEKNKNYTILILKIDKK